MMDFVLKMMDFVLKMMNCQVKVALNPELGVDDGVVTSTIYSTLLQTKQPISRSTNGNNWSSKPAPHHDLIWVQLEQHSPNLIYKVRFLSGWFVLTACVCSSVLGEP